MIQIRQAEAMDIPAISNLYKQLVHTIAPDVQIDIQAAQIANIRADPHNFLFVLEIDGQICGTVFITLCLDPMHRDQPYAFLEHFIIDENERRHGHGALLMRFVQSFCGEANCSRIMLLSNSKRIGAHAFFEKQGFSSDAKKGFVKYQEHFR